MLINIQDIRIRAHELWEQAGKPEGKDEEFWQQAERELKTADDVKPMPEQNLTSREAIVASP
jgi:hypothetical protein